MSFLSSHHKLGRMRSCTARLASRAPRVHETHQCRHDPGDVDLAFGQDQFAGLGFGKIKNVVDDVEQMTAAHVYVFDIGAILFIA